MKTYSWWNFAFIILLVFAASWSQLLPGLGIGHDPHHEARIHEMAIGLQEGNFPVIWSQNYGFGYGMPLFEFYAPLPYLFGAGWHLLGLPLSTSVELVILTATIFTALGGYILGKNLFKSPKAGLLTTTLITLAPYRAVDVFIRAAISETWAIGALIWVLIGIMYICRSRTFGWLVFSLSIVGLILSHNLTAYFSLPFLGLFTLAILYKNWQGTHWALQKSRTLLLSGLLAVGLASFYIWPALLEKHLTLVDQHTTQGMLNITQHFLYLRQFVEPWGSWEFGASTWGPDDEMSFFLGVSSIAVLGLAGIQLVLAGVREKLRLGKDQMFGGTILSAVGVALWATTLKSQAVVTKLPAFEYIQFPWRLLAIVLIWVGLLAGSTFVQIRSNTIRYWLFWLLIGLTFFINSWYFQSEKYFQLTYPYGVGYYIKTHSSVTLYDYLPSQTSYLEKKGYSLVRKFEHPDIAIPAHSIISEKDLKNYSIKNLVEDSAYKYFEIQLDQPQFITLQLNSYPQWQVRVDGLLISANSNELGLVVIDLPAGESQVEIKLVDTPVRTYAKAISLLSWSILFALIAYQQIAARREASTQHKSRPQRLLSRQK